MKYRDPSTGNFKDLHFKVSDTLPIGTITQYGGATAPEGWLICDGSAISRTSYSALFAAIGTTYGAGNGSTTFNVPDLRGRVSVGKSSDTEFDTLGETGGAKSNSYNLAHTHTQGDTGSTTLTVNQIPSHTHGYRDYYTTDITTSVQTRTCVALSLDGSVGGAGTMATGGGQGHTHTNPTTNSALSNTSISALQPYLVTNYIIKAYQHVANPILGNHIITAYMSQTEQTGNSYSLPDTGYQILPLDQYISVGNKLTLSNNKIIVGSGVSKVKISAQVSFNSVATSGVKFATIYKNNDTTSVSVRTISARDMIYNSPILVSVSENDEITLKINGSQNDAIRRLLYTYITVEVVE